MSQDCFACHTTVWSNLLIKSNHSEALWMIIITLKIKSAVIQPPRVVELGRPNLLKMVPAMIENTVLCALLHVVHLEWIQMCAILSQAIWLNLNTMSIVPKRASKCGNNSTLAPINVHFMLLIVHHWYSIVKQNPRCLCRKGSWSSPPPQSKIEFLEALKSYVRVLLQMMWLSAWMLSVFYISY